MDYKESQEAFRASCRAYRNEKENLVRYKNAQGLNALTEQMVRFMQEDVDYVDRILDRIEEKCGTNARLMIFLLFVEERTQVDIAHEFGITRRQVQYSMDKWLHAALDYTGE
ncbi:MAG: helix-turn-helix domain containing protein [Solobacterium sp.]|jgi:DNA-directed RNA polymerase specialized sigma subunit|nr:helix-turn-helix domain containing protein [Solobacterium sp.]MCH4205561.1 helix-turn-helix domain containing protein [Solobacterium sp.]MCH4227104.1 helix-turn-helix domain containing protein [Solobacterium sp.]MCH4282324.1 helix-turn-helix domain containing protein [Solobacterium sp.]